ncbi:hypothetical protein T440DRAFT_553262 [Plenodomus tracheiphilus IPT5]|uniref:Uncharacterized protein n=1 Tax=Plenodomus tracheiphilus IPT5 TaxID=1408161 RepID=A0A6A7BBL6_9PLEO|nr:hypothetical protein T440DRAFT_553262 [Plenodomus tracheiphilus IPT5]
MATQGKRIVVDSVPETDTSEHGAEAEAQYSTTAHLTKSQKLQAAPQELLYKKACQKGHMLKQLMQADDIKAGHMLTPHQPTATSKFLDHHDLDRWGYRPMVYSPYLQVTIECALDNIGLSAADVTPVCHKHDKSLSRFQQVIVPSQGMIIAYDNVSPTSISKKVPKPDFDLPDLKQWSDIAYLQWKLQAPDPTKLKYVIRYQINNAETNTIADMVNFEQDTELQAWPGRTYDVKSQVGEALLGSPNGSGVAYLLAQHKEQLGHKTVSRITMFHGVWESMVLLFHIEDVQQ